MTPTPSPDPARYVSPVCRDGSHQACANFRGTCRCTCHAAAGEGTERPDTDTLRKIGAGTDGDGITLLTRAERAFLARAADWIDAQPPVPPTPAPCPYIVTGGEGTSHCSLAERSAMHAAAPPSTPAEQPDPDGLSAAELLADLKDRTERGMVELEKLAAPLGACMERTRLLGKLAGLALVADWLRSYDHPTDLTGSEA